MRLIMKRTALALALVGAIGGAGATTLGLNVPVTSVTQVATSFGGTLLASATTLINNPSYNGTARTAVYQTESGLDFYYQFTNNLSSVNGIERFTGWNFAPLGTANVEVYQTGTAFDMFVAGTESSDGADRTTGVIGFSFIPNGLSKIIPGTTSFTQIIRTNAQSYVTGNFGLLDGIGDNAAGFSVAPVPEPETYAMFLAGLGLVGNGSRREATTRRVDQLFPRSYSGP